MPLETRDKDPFWAKGFRTSPEARHNQRQAWLQKGREIWAEGTRIGRNVVARTEQELEALGRAGTNEAARQQQQARAIVNTVTARVRPGAGAVRPGAKSTQGGGQPGKTAKT